MSVSINNDSTIAQPTVLSENLEQIQVDQFGLDGTMTRNRLGQKKSAKLQWDWLTPAQYQQLIGYFTTGSGVYYANSTSNYTGGSLTFSGMPNFQESEYVQGSSLYRKFQATVREI